MLVYNVTVSILQEEEKNWITWMKETHIPEVLATNCFSAHKVLKLIEGNQGPDPTYAIQYFCASQEELEKYRNEYATELQEKHTKLFEGKYAAFRTVLELID